jgi:acetyl esterase/lipase
MVRLTLLAGLVVSLPLFAQSNKGPKLPDGVVTHKDLAYGDHARNTLDVYIPKSDRPLPLIIWVHGGAWSAGSKDGNNPALAYLGKGYAVAAINYRYSQHAVFPAQIQDCQAAIRFLRSQAKDYNLEPDRFAAWGSSAGGHLVALMGTAGDHKAFEAVGKVKTGSNAVQAVIDWYGPIDFLQMNKQTTVKGRIDHDSPTAPEAKLIGGAVQDNKDKVNAANPMTYIAKDNPPFLIMHGDQDPLVPYGQSEMFHAALKKAGVDSELVIAKGVAHDGKVGAGERAELIESFLAKHLKKK